MTMKHNDAASHHAKRPNPAQRPHHPAHTEHGQGKKVFDVMRPGKAAASPTSRPVVVGQKAQAKRTQAAVSGIGDSVQAVVAIKPAGAASVELDEQDHAAQVAAAASASVAADVTERTDVEDRPAGAPPVAIALNPPVAVATTVAPLTPEAVANLDGEKPPAASDTPAPPEEPASEPVVQSETSEPASAPPPPPDLVPDASAPPEAGRNLSHGKTIMPLSAAQQDQTSAQPETPSAPTSDDQQADSEPSAPVPAETQPEAPKDAPKPAEKKTDAAKGPSVPELHPQDIQDIVVSHHATSVWWHSLILIILVLVLAVIALDILLDAELVDVPFNVPYTDFF